MEQDLSILRTLSGEYNKQFRYLDINLRRTFNTKSSLGLIGDSNEGVYLMKKMPPLYREYYGEEIYQKGMRLLAEYIGDLSIPLLKYLQNSKGERISYINGNTFAIAPFYESLPYDGSDQQIATTARHHALLNIALKNAPKETRQFLKQHFSAGPYLRDEPLLKLLEKAKEKLKAEIKAETKNSFIRLFEKGLELTETQALSFPPHCFDALPRQIVHKDIFPGNVLFLKNGSALIVDPDEMMFLPHLRDFCYGMWCFSTRRDDGSVTAPDPRLLKLYFDTYHQENPLSESEISLIPLMMRSIWIEEFLNFTLNVGCNDENIPDLNRKIVHLQHAIEAELALSLLRYDLLLFDFDGTIGKLAIDWPNLKESLHRHFKTKFQKDIAFTEYSKGCNLAFNEVGEEGFKDMVNIARSFEEKGLAGFQANTAVRGYVQSFSGRKVIWSSNNSKVIRDALRSLNLDHYFDYVVGREQTRMLKPSLEGFKQIITFLGKNIDGKKILFLGDSISDMYAAQAIGCDYLDVDQLRTERNRITSLNTSN